MTTSTTTSIECPVCAAPVSVPEDSQAHEVIVCSDCQSELEVTSVQPFVLDLAPEVEEDWGE